MPDVIRQVDKDNWRNKIVISIIAGAGLNTLRLILKGAELYRAMPSINVCVKKSSTAIVTLSESTYKDVVERLFTYLGSVYWVPEALP
ncbi:MAG: hypothetical protein QXJ69_05700 [Desulfurococcaceae archaeon]